MGAMESDFCVAIVSFGCTGGFAQYPALFANALSEFVNVHVFAPNAEEVSGSFCKKVRYHPFPAVPTNSQLCKEIQFAYELREDISSVDPDVIHYPFFTGLSATVTSAFLSTLNVPLIGTIHDPISHSSTRISIRGTEFDNFVYGIDLKGRLRSYSSILLDRILVHGEQTRVQARKIGYSPKKLRTVPHGLYTHFCSAPVASPHRDCNNLLFFGNIRKNKGYDRIPDIVSIVSGEVDSLSATVAGRLAEDSDWGERVIDSISSHERIDLQNEYIPTNQVQGYFEAASVVVLPYYDATSSGVAMTAYTFERPLVVTDTGDVGQMVSSDGSGLVADSNDEQSIADAIIDLLTDDELYNRCLTNVRTERDKYRWQNVTAETIDIYKELV